MPARGFRWRCPAEDLRAVTRNLAIKSLGEYMNDDLMQRVYSLSAPAARRALLLSCRSASLSIRQRVTTCLGRLNEDGTFPPLPRAERFPNLAAVRLACSPGQLTGGSFQGRSIEMHFDSLKAYHQRKPSYFEGVQRLGLDVHSARSARQASEVLSMCRGLKSAVVRTSGMKGRVDVTLRSSSLSKLQVIGDITFEGLELPSLHSLELECANRLLRLYSSDSFPNLHSLRVTSRYIHREVNLPACLHRLHIVATQPRALSLLSRVSRLTYMSLTNVCASVDLDSSFPGLLHLQLQDSTLNDLGPWALVALLRKHRSLEALTVLCLDAPPEVVRTWRAVQDLMDAHGSCDESVVVLSLRFREAAR